jgi:hypothetical protein
MSFIAAGVGLSAVSAGAGLLKSGAANKRNRGLVKEQSNLLDETYLSDMNKRYLDTDEAQSFLSTLRDRMNTSNKEVNQTAAVTGGTDESVLAGRESNGRNYADSLNKLSAQGTRYTQGLKDSYMSGKSSILGLQMSNNNAESKSGSNLFANSMSTMRNIAGATMNGGSSGGTGGSTGTKVAGTTMGDSAKGVGMFDQLFG